jgi:hypothetical protein
VSSGGVYRHIPSLWSVLPGGHDKVVVVVVSRLGLTV